MITAWTKVLAMTLTALPLGAVMALGCEVRVNDDPLDNDFDAGFDGDGGNSGSGQGGTAGSGGTGGSAVAGSGGSGGSGGDDFFPTPVCSAQVGDDACVTCLKQQCCTEWLACNDASCEAEWQGVAECVSDIADESGFVLEEEFGMCVSDNSADGSMILQSNTNALIIDCANEPTEADAGAGLTRCGEPCFGTDIFFE